MSEPATILSPSAVHVLDLVVAFLEQELLPAQSDAGLRLRTRVAANLLRSAQREFAMLECLEIDANGHALPREMVEAGHTLRSLAADLLQGRQTLIDAKVYDLALRLVEAKLAIVASGDRNAPS
jgi:hypothetical protein